MWISKLNTWKMYVAICLVKIEEIAMFNERPVFVVYALIMITIGYDIYFVGSILFKVLFGKNTYFKL